MTVEEQLAKRIEEHPMLETSPHGYRAFKEGYVTAKQLLEKLDERLTQKKCIETYNSTLNPCKCGDKEVASSDNARGGWYVGCTMCDREIMVEEGKQAEVEAMWNAWNPKECPYCNSDEQAIRDIFFVQTCEGCVNRMFK